jgi:hypothetical protein
MDDDAERVLKPFMRSEIFRRGNVNSLRYSVRELAVMLELTRFAGSAEMHSVVDRHAVCPQSCCT